MCTWYKLSVYPDRYARSLFQYVTEQNLAGFQVWLHSSPQQKIDIHIGGDHSMDIPFPVRNYNWTHLCVQWNKGMRY